MCTNSECNHDGIDCERVKIITKSKLEKKFNITDQQEILEYFNRFCKVYTDFKSGIRIKPSDFEEVHNVPYGNRTHRFERYTCGLCQNCVFRRVRHQATTYLCEICTQFISGISLGSDLYLDKKLKPKKEKIIKEKKKPLTTEERKKLRRISVNKYNNKKRQEKIDNGWVPKIIPKSTSEEERREREKIQKKESKERNREKYNKDRSEQRKEKYKNNPSYKLEANMRRRISKAINDYAIGKKSDKSFELIGCTIEELIFHIENQFVDGMSWDNYSLTGWVADHIIPLSSFNLTDPDQQKKAFHFSNLQPLMWYDNLAKANKILQPHTPATIKEALMAYDEAKKLNDSIKDLSLGDK